MLPEITIGVCVKNSEDTIIESIKSIKNQKYPHELMTLILVDDGSDDNTLSIIQEYSKKLDITTKIFSHPWKGIGFSRNVVAKNAIGKYLFWLDGDMVITKKYIYNLVIKMEKNPKLGIVKGGYYIKRNKGILATLEGYSRAALYMADFTSKSARYKSLGTGGSLYRLKALRSVGFFDNRMVGYGEDFDVEIRIRAAGWKLDTANVFFRDYERKGLTWKQLWRRYIMRGYNSHYFAYKNKGYLKRCYMFPVLSIISGVLQYKKLYKHIHDKLIFLLPLLNFYKMIAWNIGYLKAERRNQSYL